MADVKNGKILASPKFDPGLRDLFGCCAEDNKKHGGESMENVKRHPNSGIVVSEYPESYPCTDHLFEISCKYKIGDQKRSYVLVIEDMEVGYGTYVNHCIPQVKSLITLFRELKLPIVWTNWARRSDDGFYNSLDRFYGPQGIKEEVNPCYMYGEDACDTVQELAPQGEDELSRSIISMHLSKFADYDDDGREILFPMLEAWGVNTIILCGAWTDDCIAATAFDAVDKYGYDVIMVSNGVATASINGDKMSDVLYAAACLKMTSEEVVQHLNEHPELIQAPGAALRGNVRFTKTPYRQDPLIQENLDLKKRIADLEAQLSAK